MNRQGRRSTLDPTPEDSNQSPQQNERHRTGASTHASEPACAHTPARVASAPASPPPAPPPPPRRRRCRATHGP
eukprot:6200676-Pleurochrysis_carterae.AAC.2